jgi:hypothetical protein
LNTCTYVTIDAHRYRSIMHILMTIAKKQRHTHTRTHTRTHTYTHTNKVKTQAHTIKFGQEIKSK